MIFLFCSLLLAVFERLRSILHNSEIEKRVQYMVEVMFAIRKDGFKVLYILALIAVLIVVLIAVLIVVLIAAILFVDS